MLNHSPGNANPTGPIGTPVLFSLTRLHNHRTMLATQTTSTNFLDAYVNA